MPFRLPYECQNSIVLIFKDNKLERKEIFLHRWQISKMYLSQILTKMYRTYKIKAIIYKENIKQDRSKWSSRHYYSWMGRFNTIIISVFLILICASNAHISEHSVSKKKVWKDEIFCFTWGVKKIRKEDEDEFDFRHVEFEVLVGHLGTEAQERVSFQICSTKETSALKICH